jgi:hypothetical protein
MQHGAEPRPAGTAANGHRVPRAAADGGARHRSAQSMSVSAEAIAWSTVSSAYIFSMEEIPESDRAGQSPDAVDDGPRRVALSEVDPDEHVDRLRVAPRFDLAGLELVQALTRRRTWTGAPSPSGCWRPRAADRLTVAGDRRHARAGSAAAAGATPDAGPPKRQADRILTVTGCFAPRDRPSLARGLSHVQL